MKLHVIGHKGVVGSSTFELFRRLGYDVTGSDKTIPHSTMENSKPEPVPADRDIYFICVPESAVRPVIKNLEQSIWLKRDQVIIVIRSSVVPGTTQDIARTSSFHYFCHVPEFLREATAMQDEFTPYRIVIGEVSCPTSFPFTRPSQVIEQLFLPLRKPIIHTTATVSELAKLASNNYLATVITYWNFIEQIAFKLGVSGHEVGMIASLDPRISEYGARLHNKYGGRCLPKDAQQLLNFCEQIGADPTFIKTIEELNNKL